MANLDFTGERPRPREREKEGGRDRQTDGRTDRQANTQTQRNRKREPREQPLKGQCHSIGCVMALLNIS